LDGYGEPIRKTGIVIFAPGDETIEGITDNDGRIEMRNLRKIGDKYSYVILGNNK
jgi:hypothetical protein